VLIEDGKIKETGSPAKVKGNAPVGVKTIDLGGATLLPGLIDGHTYLLLDVIVPPYAESARRFKETLFRGCCWRLSIRSRVRCRPPVAR